MNSHLYRYFLGKHISFILLEAILFFVACLLLPGNKLVDTRHLGPAMEISHPNITLTLLKHSHCPSGHCPPLFFTHERTRARKRDGEERKERFKREYLKRGGGYRWRRRGESDIGQIRCLIIVISSRSLLLSEGSIASLKAHLFFSQTPPPLHQLD